MKALKVYLIVVFILLACAVFFGIYVWYVVQNEHTKIEKFGSELENVKESVTEENKTISAPIEIRAEEKSAETTDEVTTPTTEVVEPITLDPATLSDSQRKILESFGYSESITITPAMISCAEEAIGKDRLAEVMGGSAPSPLESLKLLPCFKA